MKLLLGFVLQEYDVSFESPDTKRPPNVGVDMFVKVDPAFKVLFRKRNKPDLDTREEN